jgi:hypothetical protein
LHAIEKLDDREAEADQRDRRSDPRHQRTFYTQPRSQPAEMRVCCYPYFEPVRDRIDARLCHAELPFSVTIPKAF